MIEPDSIMSSAERRARSSLPAKTRSETTLSQKNPPDLIPDTSSDSDDEAEEEEPPLTMSPAEIRVIRRLAARCNLLPVVAKADSLTDEKLIAVKEAVRQSLAEAGLDFGVFGPAQKKRDESKARGRNGRNAKPHFTAGPDTNANGAGHSSEEDDNSGDDEEEERQSRPVIKLRPSRHGRTLSRSRSRRDLSQAAEDDRIPMSPDLNDRESVANVRFSAHIVARPDLATVMPFALIAPDGRRQRQPLIEPDSQALATGSSSPVQQSEEGKPASIADTVPPTPAYLNGPPQDMKGVFVRKYRWGTIDVLDPDHCDFAALRTAVLSTHLKMLKTHTREVLYEKYRTEKLLARRATRQITNDERNRLLEDLGL